MRIAIVNSNNIKIADDAKKGTEIFAHIFIKNLTKRVKEEKLNIDIAVFASGDSNLPVKVSSVNRIASSLDKDIPDEKHIIFELALISEAFSRQDEFDIFHINIGDGDIALPFAKLIEKPVIITLHNTKEKDYVEKYFSLFKSLSNLHFISISKAQRKFFPDLNYFGTIYHGIDVVNNFKYSPKGGDSIMWAGRAIPKKGMEAVIKIARKINKKAKLFTLVKKDHHVWFQHQIDDLSNFPPKSSISIKKDAARLSLISEYQSSKLFLFPIEWEEPFGLVTIEAMASGTPVVSYARGAVPEIIKDGETGFLVNPSPKDIRGNWIIKKTGIEGLREAAERIYALAEKDYLNMRKACRKHVENNFTVERMVDEYIHAYKTIAGA
jgi:glycosyltransferase involved in cell wall biosynthesis